MPKAKAKIGPYEVRGFLARGGMAEVYRGYHPILGRDVAIKKLTNRAAAGTSRVELLQRFFREGKALAQLRHQCVVQVYELVANENDVYMVLEYVDGFDLDRVLRRGSVPCDVAVILGRDLAAALDNAHFHQIIHRDLKPGNVMISRRGSVKLMDFGIARELSGDDLTATGVTVGTPMYIAPEILEGKGADTRSDIFSLGVLLYECLCGRAPFQTSNFRQGVRRILDGGYKPLHKASRTVPRSLSKIVDGCLARNPQARYGAAGDVRRALDLFLAVHSAWTNHSARLVGFLCEQGFIDEDEARRYVGERTLRQARRVTVRWRLLPF